MARTKTAHSAAYLNGLLRPPAFVDDEILPAFEELQTALIAEISNPSIFDLLNARDYVEAIHEEQRLKYLQKEMVAAGLPLAIKTLHSESVSLRVASLKKTAPEVSGYDELAELGIGDLAIEATAYNLQREGIKDCENQILSRQKRRKRLEKDILKSAQRAPTLSDESGVVPISHDAQKMETREPAQLRRARPSALHGSGRARRKSARG